MYVVFAKVIVGFALFGTAKLTWVVKLVVVDRMGAESMAKLVFDKFNEVFSKTEGGRIKVVKVECNENKKNSGIYEEI